MWLSSKFRFCSTRRGPIITAWFQDFQIIWGYQPGKEFFMFNFPIRPLVCPLIGWLVSRSVCYDFLKRLEVTLPCSYRSTCEWGPFSLIEAQTIHSIILLSFKSSVDSCACLGGPSELSALQHQAVRARPRGPLLQDVRQVQKGREAHPHHNLMRPAMICHQ